MNIEWKFAVFALNLMILFQERVKLLVALFLELLNIFVLEYKACLEHKACFGTKSLSYLKFYNARRIAVLFKNFS